MARSHPVENLLPLNVGQLSTTFNNATELVEWAAPCFSWPQPATDHCVRDCRYNWLAVSSPALQRAVTPELHLHDANSSYKSQNLWFILVLILYTCDPTYSSVGRELKILNSWNKKYYYTFLQSWNTFIVVMNIFQTIQLGMLNSIKIIRPDAYWIL